MRSGEDEGHLIKGFFLSIKWIWEPHLSYVQRKCEGEENIDYWVLTQRWNRFSSNTFIFHTISPSDFFFFKSRQINSSYLYCRLQTRYKFFSHFVFVNSTNTRCHFNQRVNIPKLSLKLLKYTHDYIITHSDLKSTYLVIV